MEDNLGVMGNIFDHNLIPTSTSVKNFMYLDVVVELDAKLGTTMGVSSLSKTKPSGGREEELRYPHLGAVVELDAKSNTSVGLVSPLNTFDVVAELEAEPDAKSGTTVGLAPL